MCRWSVQTELTVFIKKNENSEDNEFFIDKPTQFPDGFHLNVIISPH